MKNNILKELETPFILAPLAGFTDSSFRTICKEFGASFMYTEMVSAKGLYYKSSGAPTLLKIRKEEGPVGIQIFGKEPDMFAAATRMLEPLSNVLIDINMGCPVPKVVKNGEGSALLKTPDIASDCVKATVDNTEKPVSIKMRMGFSDPMSDGEIGAVKFAQKMQMAGASQIAVHARTREDYYSGKVDWNIIKKIKENIDIPVIGNGDVFSFEDGMRMLDETGVDAVMVARGALGNPWIFRELNAAYKGLPIPKRPSIEEIVDTAFRQLLLLAEDKGEKVAVMEMRKHASFYTKGLKGSNFLRTKINTANTIEEIKEILETLKNKGE